MTDIRQLCAHTARLLPTLVVCLAVTVTVRATALQPGCDPSRRAVAHHAGGVAIVPPPPEGPIPCATVTGNSSESAAVGITPRGTVFYAPVLAHGVPAALADPALVARSRNGGASWEPVDPGPPPHFSLVPWMHVDPNTARLWLATPLPSLCGAAISWSDDEGEHWMTNPKVGCPGQGALKVLEGPAPAAGAQPLGYPHVVYYCANLQDGSPQSILICYRSLDGGANFDFVNSFPDPIPPPPACGTTAREARAGVVGPDGFLYFPMNRCDSLGIAISRDEGASWEILPVADSAVQLHGERWQSCPALPISRHVVMGRAYWIVMLAAILGLVDAAQGDAVSSHISPEELLALIESGHAPLIVDVRTQREYDAGHVPGAVHIPFYDILGHRSELAASPAPLILYCEHGPRAGIAKFQLWAAGVDRRIIYLDGHMSAWKARGLPLESATDDRPTRDGP